MDSVEKFAVEAALFERWLLDGSDRDADAAREGLMRLLRLYAAALDLPPAFSDEVGDEIDVERVGDAEWHRAHRASRRLPFDLYREVYNPIAASTEEPVTGSVSDDLADIYRDIATGLRAFEQGRRTAAVWEWSFGLHSHWGAHVTSAIRALHWWLVDNAIDRLSVEDHGAS